MSTQNEDHAAALYAVPEQLIHHMGITVDHVSPERVTGTMPVLGNVQPYGMLHGGASAALIETLGSIGAALHAGTDRVAVGVDLNATHVRAARAGMVHGVADAVHLGRSTAVYEVRLTDDDGKLICTGRLTCAVRDRAPGAEEATAPKA